MTPPPLSDLRRAVDDIDKVLLNALGERARLMRDITAAKSDADQPLRDEVREAALLAHRAAYGERLGLDPALVRRLYREILDDALRRQRDWLQERPDGEPAPPLSVAYQGTEGAYGHEAAVRHFGVERRVVTFKPYRSFRETLDAVQRGDVQRAVVPIENSTAGSVHEVYDLLFQLNLGIVGEEIVEVKHCLVGVTGATVGGLARVLSHPQALAQCSEFLAEHPEVELVPAANTALAAKRIADEGRPDQGAIASVEAADRFGLVVLARDIANQAVNLTRFVVVAATPSECDPKVDAKVALVFGTRHERGALVRCLNVLADEGISLTKLESRPRPGVAWEYVFYVDLEGHVAEPRMQAALTRLAGTTQFVRLLGCFPRAIGAAPTPGQV
jgi:chorismate mutase / prephenate dehydratase